jgi:hypothetical protein
MSGAVLDCYREQRLAFGTSRYLPRPFECEALISAVRECLREKTRD